MEILTYSLWFTLVWWILCIFANLIVRMEYWNRQENKHRSDKKILPLSLTVVVYDLVMIPLVAILLEYLIVR